MARIQATRRQATDHTPAYVDILKPVRARFGTVPLQELTADNVEAVKAAMLDGSARRIGVKGKPMSARSVNFMLGTLQQALDQAVKRRKVATNAAAMVERVASDTKPGAAWTVAESNAFKAVAARDRLHAAWLLTCYGLRRGEVLGLRWARDVNLTEGIVTIRVSRTLVRGGATQDAPG
jgi:integrase